MKKLILFVLIFVGFKSVSHAAWGDDTLVNRSSWTTTNDSLALIGSTTIRGGIFVGVVIGSPAVAGSVIFYDSNKVAASTIGIVSMQGTGAGAFYVPFEVRLSSGLTYTTSSNNSAGVTIIYKITQAN